MSVGNPVSLPQAGARLVDAGGLTSREFYRFFQSLASINQTNTSQAAIAAINAKIAAIQAEIDALPKSEGYPTLQVSAPLTSSGLLQNGFALLGLNVADSLTVQGNALQLEGDVANPGNTWFYGTSPTGVNGWQSIASALLGSTEIALDAGSDGRVKFGLTPIMATAQVNLTYPQVVALNGGEAYIPDLTNPVDVQAIAGVTAYAASAGDPVKVTDYAVFYESAWSWTPGRIYCSQNAGQLTQTPPTFGAIVEVARVIDPHTIFIHTQPAILLAA